MGKKSATPSILTAITGGYAGLLADIKQRIRAAQVRTAMAGNASMLMLYWEIGGVLAQRQKQEGWGAAFLPKLATDLHNDLPEIHGFSERNMRRMIQFHKEYPDLFSIWPLPVAKSGLVPEAAPIGPRPVAQLTTEPDNAQIGQRTVAQLPWAHNVILIQQGEMIATSLSIELVDLELSLFNQRGGLGKAHQLFGAQLPKLLDELNEALAA